MKPSLRVPTDLPGVVHHPSRQENPQTVQTDGALSYWALALLPVFAIVFLVLRSVPRRIRATVTGPPYKPPTESLRAQPKSGQEEAVDIDILEREIHAFYATEDGQKH